MVDIEWLREEEVIRVRPIGPIDDGDFAQLGAVVDPVIARRGRLEGLLIDARGFAGWDDARALVAHLRFVRAHAPKVARIAAVGDQWWLSAAPAAEPLFGAPVRVFGAEEEAAAKAWLLESPPEPPSVTFLPGSEGAEVAIRVTGRLSDVDLEEAKAELERRLPTDGRLRVLAIIDEGFRGWTPKGCLEDVAMAFAPWSRRFEKLALVSGPGFVRWCAENFPAALAPYPIKVFGRDELDAAYAWLRS